MIQTWLADILPLMDENLYESLYRLLPLHRQQKADALRRPEDRARSVGAWILYQKMCRFYRLPADAPFNLSHSGRYALCSVDTAYKRLKSSGSSLGCDIEMLGKFHPGIIRHFFCPAETDYIRSQKTAALRTDAFYRYWVLKESFMKATGLGMRLELKSFEIRIGANGPELIRQPADFPGRYFYQEYEPRKGDAKIAVCSSSSEFGPLKQIALSGE